ncbi:DUF3566 domain-containing protein [Gordonia sp. ABSL49_1]|uniref:DUF3566 domain-containing protein n=1 Tax=Gordonia sp. ABSL49_1 TaxID=2920941 RepID=UPI001F10FC4F|nr:DUF3566 domain-containing protein [Gordonia sp. ABSL49_1]MCH5641365.1 DUF3566 domain-containing protein [Gordonia sp. ABSL49_1]
MSTPNNRDKDNGGPSAGGQPGTGTPTGGLVPPWQRGQTDSRDQVDPGVTQEIERPTRDTVVGPPNGQGAPAGPSGPPQNGQGGPPQNGQGGPPPRGIVSSGTAAASMSGQQAPVTNLENPPRRTATATQEPTQRFVESPTSTIERDQLQGQQLPDLDAIHHTEAKQAAANNAAAAAVTKPSARSAPAQVRGNTPLRAAVQIRRIDPWATFKIAAVLSVIGFIIWMIAIAVLYLVLDGMGVWDQVNNSFGTLVTADGSASEGDIVSATTVFGASALLGAVNAILITALATIGSYIYNICADLVGGAEVTLADLD